MMSSDLGLDPSDPLNLLLHNNSQSGDSSMDESSSSQSEGGSPPDWSQLTSMWNDNEGAGGIKSYSELLDFSDLTSLPMDIDFNQSMVIEPSALHYDPMKFNQQLCYDDPSVYNMSNEFLASQFPFTFQSAFDGNISSASSSASPELFHKERRLSITSSSSSSGASLSPVPESTSSLVLGYTSDSSQPQTKQESVCGDEPLSFNEDPAAELAHRVRQSAGVLLAVPKDAQIQSHSMNTQAGLPTTCPSQKLPIPRLQRRPSTKASSPSSSSSAASTPPPSTPPTSSFLPPKLSINPNLTPSVESSTATTPTTAQPTMVGPRPKTSHTTIERRYRTNLNARIQSLRMAVPALRVLEDKEGGNGKKIKKNVKGGVFVKGSGINIPDSEDGTVIDVIDERGFVDGVKVARKCSKANVLGKAVEYIRVLKKRENRLKAEQAGLKTLVAGLVGGPALLKEWEREWRQRFGGEEKDEVEGDDIEGDDEESDEEDGDEGDEELGRKRKRPKFPGVPKKAVAERKASTPATGGDSGVPEKRKRGRPRKAVPPPATAATVVSPLAPLPQTQPQDQTMLSSQEQWIQVHQQQQQSQPQQYLLAVFALFSFFNSPLTSSSSRASGHHQHTGTVLTSLHPPLAYAPEIISQFAAPSSSPVVPGADGWGWKEYVQMFHLFVSIVVLASFVLSWAGITLGMGRSRSVSFTPTNVGAKKQRRKEEVVDWISVGDECILAGNSPSVSLYTRWKVYRAISLQPSSSMASISSLAMLVYGASGIPGGLARAKARSLWDSAKAHALSPVLTGHSTKKQALAFEVLVLESMDVTEAVERLSEASEREKKGDAGRTYKPIEVLGCLLVKQRVKQHLGELFVDSVYGSQSEKYNDKESVKRKQGEMRRTIDAARELGGQVEELGRVLEKVWKTPGAALDHINLNLDKDVDVSQAQDSVDAQINALLSALVLHRRVFSDPLHLAGCSSALLSPPPSPTLRSGSKGTRMVHALRQALGSRVFENAEDGAEGEGEEGGRLEDARDRVVDLIVEMERSSRGASAAL
ncbi:uncharacterized protein LACBIDRAFT_304339 [Laccaria bicolor S238N-H82]|uniref:Predicted protein n=1 Tax=Laccaria bicolor (strain S238N-H82 / ATCC MYA-4686) TaxID=486041 RepID=B0DLF0_LACBS|nr:uncharacterized protein LACBIDRAFT_304339 [Laccaria bicolor S238N-H82]EDR04636.1 predicted protein [Laccaria bicolor S238N-H82]|eukprot:XP_001884808.1 predicted protein [Laccaria bicolor S238N-H82]